MELFALLPPRNIEVVRIVVCTEGESCRTLNDLSVVFLDFNDPQQQTI